MKDHLKNPNLYYILIPVAAAVWALTAGFVFYPKAVEGWQAEKDEREEALKYMQSIIELQPDRLKSKSKSGQAGEFDFTETVNALTQIFKIPSSKYTLNVRGEITRAGKKARPATMTLKDVNIETMARFLSAMLSAWPDLQCEVLGLEKSKAGKDSWKVDLSLTYYY